MSRLTAAVLSCVALLTVVGRQSSATAASTPTAIGSPSPGEVAITVDDIPEHGGLVAGFTRQSVSEQIIRALRENGAVGSRGFATGEFFDERPQELEIFKLWLDAGFPLGNHTYRHLDLTHVSAQEFIRDIEQQDRLLARLQPTSPLMSDRYVFRYPYLDEGNTLAKRNAVRRYLAQHHYRIAEVTTDYFDWAWVDAFARCTVQHDQPRIAWLEANVIVAADRHLRTAQMEATLLFGHDIPQILLLHVGEFDAITLGAVLKHWRAEGVKFISLDTALADPVYSINPNVVWTDGRDFLAQIAMSRKLDIESLIDPTYTIDNLNQLCPERAQQ